MGARFSTFRKKSQRVVEDHVVASSEYSALEHLRTEKFHHAIDINVKPVRQRRDLLSLKLGLGEECELFEDLARAVGAAGKRRLFGSIFNPKIFELKRSRADRLCELATFLVLRLWDPFKKMIEGHLFKVWIAMFINAAARVLYWRIDYIYK